MDAQLLVAVASAVARARGVHVAEIKPRRPGAVLPSGAARARYAAPGGNGGTLLAVSALLVAVSCGSPYAADGRGRPLRATVSQGDVDGTCWDVELDSVSRLRVDAQEVQIRGAMRSGPLPEHMAPAERTYRRASQREWTDATADWEVVRDSTRLRHLATGFEISFEFGRGSNPPIFAAARTGERDYAVVIASGDWKVGPRPSFWCEATVGAGVLRRR